MRENMINSMRMFEIRIRMTAGRLLKKGMKKEPGIDGILVTVGLCIIALVLCVVMKSSLQTFIEGIVGEMTKAAKEILQGVYSGGAGGTT